MRKPILKTHYPHRTSNSEELVYISERAVIPGRETMISRAQRKRNGTRNNPAPVVRLEERNPKKTLDKTERWQGNEGWLLEIIENIIKFWRMYIFSICARSRRGYVPGRYVLKTYYCYYYFNKLQCVFMKTVITICIFFHINTIV